jgi:hypothetical protein
MPTVLRKEGFEVMIYPGDHEPAHAHVFKGEGEAKIDISTSTLVEVWGMKKKDARKAKKIVSDHRDDLQSRWDEING